MEIILVVRINDIVVEDVLDRQLELKIGKLAVGQQKTPVEDKICRIVVCSVESRIQAGGGVGPHGGIANKIAPQIQAEWDNEIFPGPGHA